MTRTPERIALALFGFTLALFVAKLDLAYGSEEKLASLAPALSDTHFAYTKTVIQPSNHLEDELETKNYLVRSLSFPSIGDNGQKGNLVTGLYYESKLPGKKKLVIVLPIWGTHTYPPRKITESLLKYSDGQLNVFRILGENFLLDWQGLELAASEEALAAVIHRSVERVHTQVIDVRRFIDWAETRPDIDPDRIGLIGFSLGAMVASHILANEPRVGATALVMGGAHPHQMFANCFGRAEKSREAIMARFGWSKDTFQKKMEKPLAPINPTRYTGKVDPDQMIIFDARYDTCMPKSARDGLWYAMGQPRRITWPYGHKAAFLTMTVLGFNTMRRKIYRFLEQTL